MTRRSSFLWSFFEVETSDGVKLHTRIFKPRGEPEDNLIIVLQFQKLMFIGYKKLLASEFGVPLWDGYTDVKQFVNKLKSVTGRAETHLIEGVGHR